MLAFENVSVRFDGVAAVDCLSFEVTAGVTTVLLGPSGCGKSTILRLAVGLLRPDEGRVAFEGAPVEGAALARLRRRTGYVIQEGGLFPHLTGRGNVHLAGRALGWSKDRVRERIARLTELVHLEPSTLDRYPLELSGGQRQRVSLMRALLGDPDVLLLDEPFGALDPLIRYGLQQEIAHVARERARTILLVTHDLAEAGFLGDRVLLLDRGHVVQHGSFQDLLDAPANDFVRLFVEAQRPVAAPGGTP